MASLNEQRLPLWPVQCEAISITDRLTLRASIEENVFFQVITGRLNAAYEGHTTVLTARNVVVLARETQMDLDPADGQAVRISILRLRHSRSPENFDLARLCLSTALVDSFFVLKPRICILTDREYIYVVFGAMSYEWKNQLPEHSAMMQVCLSEFFIKLARSYHAHNRPTGIHYLSLARAFIQQNFQGPLTVDMIADHAGISRSYLAQLFAAHMDRSVVEYIQSVRCDHAAYLLCTTRFSVVDIAMECGFNSRQHFARTFNKVYGMTPHDYRLSRTTL